MLRASWSSGQRGRPAISTASLRDATLFGARCRSARTMRGIARALPYPAPKRGRRDHRLFRSLLTGGGTVHRERPTPTSTSSCAMPLALRRRVPVRDLDFVLPAGRWTCLLGPSGVGKSSLLRVIAGLAPLDRRGRLHRRPPLAGRLAWMSQRDDLLPWLSVIGNVTLGARLRGESAIAPGDGPAGAGRPRRPAGPAAGDAVGRPAPARRARPHAAGGSPGGADGRAVLGARRHHPRPPPGAGGGLLAGRTVLLVTHDPLEALRLGHRIQVMTGHPARIEGTIEPPARRRAISTIRAARPQGDLLARLPMCATTPLEQSAAAPRPAGLLLLAGPVWATGVPAFLLPPPTAVPAGSSAAPLLLDHAR